MGYVSFNLQIAGRKIVIVGGGAVAERKILNILTSGAEIAVVAPALTHELQQLRDAGTISHINRKYRPGDLDAAFLVIAATDDRETNLAIAAEAESAGVLAEITDNPAAGSVTSPAVIRQGDLSIAISTNNRAPALAAAIKKELVPLFGDEYAKSVHLLGIIREKLLTEGSPSTYNKQVLRDLAGKLPALFASRADNAIDQLLQQQFGAHCSLAYFEALPGENR